MNEPRFTGLSSKNLDATLRRLPPEVAAFAKERCEFSALSDDFPGTCVPINKARGEWLLVVLDNPRAGPVRVQTYWAHEIAHAWLQSRGEVPVGNSQSDIAAEERKVEELVRSWGFTDSREVMGW